MRGVGRGIGSVAKVIRELREGTGKEAKKFKEGVKSNTKEGVLADVQDNAEQVVDLNNQSDQSNCIVGQDGCLGRDSSILNE